MRLDGVLGMAQSGLSSVSRQIGLVGQNIANANTAGYVRQSAALSSVADGNDGLGVRTGIATRSLDAALQAEVLAAGGQAAGDGLRSEALAKVDGAAGAPGSGTDLPSLLGNLRDAFSALAGDPSNTTQQRAVVNAAGVLARGINAVGGAIASARQSAQDGMRDDATKANAALRQLGTLSDAIMQGRIRGESTADLENKRDAAMATTTELTGARFLQRENGDLLAFSGGSILDIRAGSGPLAVGDAALATGTIAPPLLLNGAPVTLEGGRLGVAQSLRDQVLPELQAGVDGLARSLAGGFSSAGLTLFTDAGGTVPASAGGFANTIKVADAVAADPARVRDGAGGATTAGNTAVINTVLNTVLATGTGTVAAAAASLTAAHADLAAAAAKQYETQQGVQSSLAAKLSAGTGVSVDTEMASLIRLQNSYGANAKVISTLQAIFNQMIGMVQ